MARKLNLKNTVLTIDKTKGNCRMNNRVSHIKQVYDFTTPLEGFERALSVASFDWDRVSDDELKFMMDGRWCQYKGFFEYCDDLDIIQMTCWAEGVFVGDRDVNEIAEFLLRVNEQLWIGHFSWDEEAQTITYRHTFLAHEAHNIEATVLMDVLDAAKIAFDRFRPFFQMLVTGEIGLQQSINVAYMDTMGEA